MRSIFIRLSILLSLPTLLAACERPFSYHGLVENSSQETLMFLENNYTDSTVVVDSLIIPPGVTDTIYYSYDPTARVPEPLTCGLLSRIDSLIISNNRILTKDLEESSNWELLDFEPNNSQTCIFRVTDADLQ